MSCAIVHHFKLMVDQIQVPIVCMLLQASNQKCNKFQTLIGTMLHSYNVSDDIIHTFHQMCLSTSPNTVRNQIRALADDRKRQIRELVANHAVAYAYDNLNILQRVGKETAEH